MGLENYNVVLILLSCVLFSSLFFNGNANDPEVDDETTFSYELGAPNGPQNWSNLNTNWSRCGTGTHQSPINILTSNVSSRGNLIRCYKPAPARITNRGHDIEVVWTGDAGGIIINGTEFKLEQCHWHTPSDHKLNSIRFEMELHIVHFSAQRDIAVVGLLYKLGYTDPFLKKYNTLMHIVQHVNALSNTPSRCLLAPFIPSATRNGTNLGIVDPNKIGLKKNYYYNYNGSLTTPPCSENVTWSISREVRTVSYQQIEALRNAVHDEHGITGNARPIQDLNGRPVYLLKSN